jgi:hypothetical protein
MTMDKEGKSRLEKIEALTVQRLRAQLQAVLNEFKAIYEGMTPTEQRQFKDWLDDAIRLQQRTDSFRVHIGLQIEFSQMVDDENEHAGLLSVRQGSKAIECWDRGETYPSG